MNHPSPERIIAFNQGRLDRAAWLEVQRHLAGCEECWQWMSTLSASEPQPLSTDGSGTIHDWIEGPAASSPGSSRTLDTGATPISVYFEDSVPVDTPVVSPTPSLPSTAAEGDSSKIPSTAGPSSGVVKQPAGESTPSTVNPEARSSAAPKTEDTPTGGGDAIAAPVPEVPGYLILARVGQGGMGVVYRARQLGLNRIVALKMIRSGAAADRKELDLFHAEAQAIARLHHPHIVQIYDVGEHRGQPYLALEFVEGGNLAAELKASPKGPRNAAALVEILARAMQAAHDRNLVHRDLKPANVLIGEDGTPKITDFGLAKQMDMQSAQTYTSIIGTPPYMAPEQAAGRGKDIGACTDVYALGGILYEMLTGQPPFRAATVMETLDLVCNHDPVPPRRFNSKLPRDLETICLKCLEKRPEKRYASATALADDLRCFLDRRPIVARPAPVWERAVKYARRRPAVAGLVGVSAVALISLIAGGFLYVNYRNSVLQQALDRRKNVDELVVKGRESLAARDPDKASAFLTEAKGLVEADNALIDLADDVDLALTSAQNQIADRQQRAKAQEDFGTFQRKRDDALFYSTLTARGEGTEDNLRRCQEAAREALAVAKVEVDSNAPPVVHASLQNRSAEIVEGCYELLHVLAEVAALPGADGMAPLAAKLQEAIRILDRAAGLGLTTKAYYSRRARYLEQLGDKAGARQATEEAAKRQPTSALDFYLLGEDAYNRQQDIRQATAFFESALIMRPGHFWARYFVSVCYLRRERFVEAKNSLTLCLDQRPDLVWVYLMRGFTNGQLGEFEAAREDFDKAAKLPLSKSDSYVLYANRAMLAILQKKYDAAAESLQEAIRLRPDLSPGHVTLAQLYQDRAKLDHLDLTQAALLVPGPAAALVGPAAAAWRARLLRQASEQLELALKLEPEPGLAALYRTRARISLDKQNWAEALADFDLALARGLGQRDSQERAQAHLQRGRLQQRMQRPKEAAEAFREAAKNDPQNATSYLGLAESLLRFTPPDYAGAIAAFDDYFRRGGKASADTYRARGLARQEMGRSADAIHDFTLALEQRPDDLAARTARGWAYVSSGALRLALTDFSRAIEQAPADGDAYNGRGYARAKLGELAPAIADAEEAVRLGPSTPIGLWKTARIYSQAAAQLDANSQSQSMTDRDRRARWEKLSVELLSRAVQHLPAEERGEFWQGRVLRDAALAPLRRSAAFRDLDAKYGQPGRRFTNRN